MARKIFMQDSNNSYKLNDLTKSTNITFQMIRRIKNIYGNKIYLSIKEASQITNMSYDFIREKIKTGKIAANSYGDRYMINIYELSRILVEGIS